MVIPAGTRVHSWVRTTEAVFFVNDRYLFQVEDFNGRHHLLVQDPVTEQYEAVELGLAEPSTFPESINVSSDEAPATPFPGRSILPGTGG